MTKILTTNLKLQISLIEVQLDSIRSFSFLQNRSYVEQENRFKPSVQGD
jgi:hypothetical protein